jgi:hypothetical protein
MTIATFAICIFLWSISPLISIIAFIILFTIKVYIEYYFAYIDFKNEYNE